jgi:hypothetical protein
MTTMTNEVIKSKKLLFNLESEVQKKQEQQKIVKRIKAVKCLLRIRNRSVSKSFYKWQDQVKSRDFLQRTARKVVQRWRGGTVQQTLDAWHHLCMKESHARRELAKKSDRDRDVISLQRQIERDVEEWQERERDLQRHICGVTEERNALQTIFTQLRGYINDVKLEVHYVEEIINSCQSPWQKLDAEWRLNDEGKRRAECLRKYLVEIGAKNIGIQEQGPVMERGLGRATLSRVILGTFNSATEVSMTASRVLSSSMAETSPRAAATTTIPVLCTYWCIRMHVCTHTQTHFHTYVHMCHTHSNLYVYKCSYSA